MALVKFKQKRQVTLFVEICKVLSVGKGNVLEANIEDGKTALGAKTVMCRGEDHRFWGRQ